MDRLDTMSLLLAVIDTGSLSAAGRRLNMPLATVSRRISELEAHLKTRLLQRSSRRVTLTDAGLAYVAACRRILDEVTEAERAAAGEYSTPRGELGITAAMLFGRRYMIPIVTAFLAAYPDIDVRMVLSDGVVDLLQGHIDVAVRLGPLADSSLRALRVGFIQRVACASPDYLAARGTPAGAADLAGHDRINFLAQGSRDFWSFQSGDVTSFRARLTVNSAEAAVQAALAGAGITTVFNYHAADSVRAGRLVLLPLYTDRQPIPVSLVYAIGGMLPQKLRAFLDYAAPRLKARLGEDSVE
jgi:DNA-binding transcriptional LysR family regulator